jgi:cytochrome c biogenesis protein CcmG/thiol:disulfide interchange protein DsbE
MDMDSAPTPRAPDPVAPADAAVAPKRPAWRGLLPLAIFAVLVAFLFVGLFRDPREVPSPLVDRPAPAFTLANLHRPAQQVATADFKGQVWLLNVWASWCVSCRVEHPLLIELAKSKAVPIVGLNYKDKSDEGIAWLAQHGDPYTLSVVDADGRVGIDWGVYGVPETFVVDKAGIIRYKHIGPVTVEALQATILPLVRKLQQS